MDSDGKADEEAFNSSSGNNSSSDDNNKGSDDGRQALAVAEDNSAALSSEDEEEAMVVRGVSKLWGEVNHIAIVVSDVGTSLQFYTDIIGMRQIMRPNFDRFAVKSAS